MKHCEHVAKIHIDQTLDRDDRGRGLSTKIDAEVVDEWSKFLSRDREILLEVIAVEWVGIIDIIHTGDIFSICNSLPTGIHPTSEVCDAVTDLSLCIEHVQDHLDPGAVIGSKCADCVSCLPEPPTHAGCEGRGFWYVEWLRVSVI